MNKKNRKRGTAHKYFNFQLEELLANEMDNLGVKHV